MYWIWIKAYDNGKHIYSMRYWKSYVRKGYAERIAKEYWKNYGTRTFETTVSTTNPLKGES